ncbi:MAG: hypothetical protein L6Q54_09985 [Leptospiraceae bacterium]|nr:hypothetical protein [Leptospiraceae bacterium]MCK6381556.1 hypothetical protein [Leptospiraceae bacterium]
MNPKKKFLFIFIVFCLPFLFTFIEIFFHPECLKLSGSVPTQEEPKFYFLDFFSGKFQKSTENYLASKSGSRWVFIRFRNQIHYSLFHKIYGQKTVFGKKDYLFEKDHIEAHLGIDYLGDKKIEEIGLNIKKLKNILQKRNIPLFILLAPGKASFYPEYISEEMLSQKKENSNYKKFKKVLEENYIHCIDFISWMKGLQGEKMPFYPKGGTHWSYYTASIAMPVIIQKISEVTNKNFPKISVQMKSTTTLPYYNLDSDIFNSLNLLWSLPFGKYIEPEILIENTNFYKPNVLIVGDSFYFTLSATKLPEKLFSIESNFYYYDKINYSINGKTNTQIEKFDLNKDIFSKDIIILLVSEVNLKYFGYGFIEKVITEEKKSNTIKKYKMSKYNDRPKYY